MHIPLFRAIAASAFDPQKIYRRYTTQRPPSNIPYVVDNLLEWLRPDDMPDRRFCAYANLTPEQALRNANPVDQEGDRLEAYVLEFHGNAVKMANLPQDARYHPDIRALQKLVVRSLDAVLQSSDWTAKMAVAPLFMPCLTKMEMDGLRQSSPLVEKILAQAQSISQFWDDARFIPGKTAPVDGELFFELVSPDAGYSLRK